VLIDAGTGSMPRSRSAMAPAKARPKRTRAARRSTTGVIELEAVVDGRVAAIGAAGTNAAMAGLFFGSTMPWARGRGLQLAMIRHRIKLLQESGAIYVRAAAAVASSSERNFRRAGLEVAYTRTLWERRVAERSLSKA